MDAKENYKVCCGESDVKIDLKRGEKALNKLQGHFSEQEVNEKDKWHHRFLHLADVIAQWSQDPSTKCGAVIVDDKRRIVATGYNGFPRGIEDNEDRLVDRDTKYSLTLHAEVNALMFANTKVEGYTIYTTPLPPCIRCAVMIVQSGISTVVAKPLPEGLSDRWSESVEQSKGIFAEAGIKYIEI